MNEWYRPWVYSSQWIMNTHWMRQCFSIWSLFWVKCLFYKVYMENLFLTALLRLHFHALKSAHFKCVIQGFLVNVLSCESNATSEEHFHYMHLLSPPIASPYPLAPRKPLAYFHLYRFGQSILIGCIFKISDRVDNITYRYHKSEKSMQGKWGNKHHAQKRGRWQGVT